MNNKKGDNDLEEIISSLTKRVKELEDINEGHRQLNAELRTEIKMWKDMASEYEKTKNLSKDSTITDLDIIKKSTKQKLKHILKI